MTRKLASILLVSALACVGCDKVKLPRFGKKAQPTPVPARPVVETKPAPASAPAAAPAAPSASAPPAPDTHVSAMVLCYHRLEEHPRPKDPLAITPAEFEKQMSELKASGFTVVPMQDFIAWRRGEKSIPDKSCVITIDDGYRSGYTTAWPILKKFGYPFTMFIYTNFVRGQPNSGGQSMSWEELAEMRDAGVDIQSHTISHSNLRVKTGKYQKAFPTYEEWLRSEMAGSKKMLEQRLGIAVNCLAYPYGNHSDIIRKIAMDSGYDAAFTVYGQRLSYHSPAAQLGRYAVESSKPQIFEAALKMEGGGASAAMDETSLTMNAASSMVTEPMEGETITNPQPTLKANLATLGDIEPKSVAMRVSGIGAVAAAYDPATKMVEAHIAQKLRDKSYTVFLTVKAAGRKVETKWNFNFNNGSAPDAMKSAPLPVAEPPKKPRR